LYALATEVRVANIEKRNLGWDLEELEQIAREGIERAPDSDDADD